MLWSYLSLPLQSEGGRLTVNKSLSQPFKDPHESELFKNDHDRDLRVTAVAELDTPLRKSTFPLPLMDVSKLLEGKSLSPSVRDSTRVTPFPLSTWQMVGH